MKDKVFFSTVERRRKSKLKKIKNMPLEPYQKRNLTSEKFNAEHYLFDELVMVPLLFAGYNCSQKKIIDNQVRTVDIFPTFLKILGIKFDENSRDGRSLVSLMNLSQDVNLPINEDDESSEAISNELKKMGYT